MAVVLQRQRKGDASIQKGQHHYGSSRSDKLLTYSIHIERAFNGLVELGYLEVTKGGYFDRVGRKDGSATSRLMCRMKNLCFKSWSAQPAFVIG